MKVLDRSWTNCLRMWKGVSENLPNGFSKLNSEKKEEVVKRLKAKWIKDNRFTKKISQDCFFCEYTKRHVGGCKKCPAVLVEPDFHCDDTGSSFRFDPIRFYIRLLELDSKRRT